MTIVLSAVFGLLFGAGLILSGMTDPDRVIGFLDVAGSWDPSLAFVMGGAVITAAPIFIFARRRPRPLAAPAFDTPQKTALDSRLLAGSAIFGVGWGLAGLCPGPALVNLGIGPTDSWIFVAAMLAGLAAGAAVERIFPPAEQSPAEAPQAL